MVGSKGCILSQLLSYEDQKIPNHQPLLLPGSNAVKSFDKHSTFLSDAAKAVTESHESFGSLGSSLLSLRNDLKLFCTDAKINNLGLSVQKKGDACIEQYVIRLMNHLLRVTVTSHKPNAFTQPRKTPDTALKIKRMQDAITLNVGNPYAFALVQFLTAAFKHNSETCSFQADSEDGEWYVMFQDMKNRTTAEIDILPNEEADYEPTFIFQVELPKAIKPIKTKKKAALLSIPSASPLASLPA